MEQTPDLVLGLSGSLAAGQRHAHTRHNRSRHGQEQDRRRGHRGHDDTGHPSNCHDGAAASGESSTGRSVNGDPDHRRSVARITGHRIDSFEVAELALARRVANGAYGNADEAIALAPLPVA